MSKNGRYSANRIKIQEKTANFTVEVSDCGTLFVIDPAADTLVTMPTAAACGKGWWIEVMVDEEDGDVVDNDVNIGFTTSSKVTGLLVAGDGGGSSIGGSAAHDFIVFDAGQSKSGELVRIMCLGDRFVAHGFIEDATDTKFHTAALS